MHKDPFVFIAYGVLVAECMHACMHWLLCHLSLVSVPTQAISPVKVFDSIREEQVSKSWWDMPGAKFTAHMRAALQGAPEAGLHCVRCVPQDKPGAQ